MAHPPTVTGLPVGDDPPEADVASPVGDLDEWRPPDRGAWAPHLARIRARVSAGTIRAALGGVGVVVLLFGGWWLLRPPAPPIETELPLAQTGETGSIAATTSPPEVQAQSQEIVVQAAGAVGRPGVHHLPSGSRVDDLVRSAGGLAPAADAARVNLAAPLQDGERIWVPRVGEEETPVVIAGSGGAPVGGAPDGLAGEPALVNLNTATSAELEALPGIGPATASAVLDHRDQIGTFGSVDELIDVRGIGEAKLEQLRPLVTV